MCWTVVLVLYQDCALNYYVLFVIAYVVIVNSNEYWLLSSVIVQHIQTHGFSNGTCGYLKHGVTKDAFIALHTAVGVRKYCD